DSIERDFSPKSNRFDRPKLTFPNSDDVEWVIPPLSLQPHFRVLEVAAGTGELSRAIAPVVRQVTLFDRDRTQLEWGLKIARKTGMTNLSARRGFAESLPYADNTFDVVVTRLGFHHFKRPEIVLAQMKRVCRTGGKIVVIDRVAPGNSAWAREYDRLETLRDPSHVRAVPLYEIKQLFREAGLSIVRTESRDVPIDFPTWIDRKVTPPELEYKFYVELKRDIDGESVTGMRPFWQGDRLFFLQIVAMTIGRK
ncbi:MAG TPA: methyltransferase domain-containing protein, partial [Oscillatoriales cyanobacterium M4454_W2019_049]|nr:methyltransferase domain-containing protein [Oscillatoriales cyanobacterium M4454_W2019_049]